MLSRPAAVVAVLVILAAANLANNYVAVPAYVATALIATALLFLVHRAWGGTWDDVGLSRAALPRGARWAMTLIAIVALCYLLAALVPASRVLFVDGRVERAGSAAIAFQMLIRIPLGTVLLEEVAFRGVLNGLLRRGCGIVWTTIFSSVLFALWHIPPALHLANANPALAGVNTAAAVALALVGAALAGVALCELRRRSGSLLAPIGLHWATNALGYLTATVVLGGF
jgi:membrane protease YdiL (CAAX protease family)